MWRSFFLAVGISLCILGGECLIVERAVVKLPGRAEATSPTFYDDPAGAQAAPAVTRREIVPPEWAPWSLLSAGAVVTLYSITLARA